ncbi:MAG: glycosyltransferase family 2 protein [Eubacteriales bacterium]|nr:glycosyltransferase family 2 protein [Eubacteriales bacterium]
MLRGTYSGSGKVSVIIPARNEEKNLPHLLESLKEQSYQPYEVIVVDDSSTDATVETALRYDTKVIKNKNLPQGWTGKTWAVWNGYLNSTGDILLFIDADVRLRPGAMEALLKAREDTGGVISVVPYHIMERAYEQLSLVSYLLGVFAFISPFEINRNIKPLYGACIMAERAEYERIGGHESIRSEILDDINLGKRFSGSGIKVCNYIGNGLVAFRMYPYGLKNELQGFSKGALNASCELSPTTTAIIGIWVAGLAAAGFAAPALTASGSTMAVPFALAYLGYVIQILYFTRHTGTYGIIMPALHFLPSLFFICVLGSSFYQLHFVGAVTWKGRQVIIRIKDVCTKKGKTG